MFKKVGLLFLIFLLCGLSGCGRAATAQNQEEHRITDISSIEAETLSMAGNIQEIGTLKGDEFILADADVFARHVENVGPGNHTELELVIRNADSAFYQIVYAEDMAQYSYRNQIYMRPLGKDEDTLLYDTSDAYWLNEICANDTYLYWVEYVSSTTSDGIENYIKVMQCRLDNGDISCIAERKSSEYYEICLAVSDRFLTWYDIHMHDTAVELVVFDIEKQEFQERTDTDDDIQGLAVTLYNPYVVLKTTENCITYFMQDDQEQLYIRREDLHTGATDTFLLGKTKPYYKIAACYSDSRYIGWYTDYGDRGDYYFYDTVSEKLYLWNVKKDDMYVFSNFFCRGKLYFNNTNDHNVYVWDLSTGQVYRQSFGEDAYWIRSYGDNLLYLGTSSMDTKGYCSLYSGD
ncbi:MAG: hypothetical protein HDR02_03230 [Lachnospiraceae bacterium]|nr:hypothetical protein [Lachnospiraceae bacterium]